MEIRVITLELGDHLESVVLRLKKGWKVRFVKGASLLGRDVKVHTSISGELDWIDNADELAAFSEINCVTAGAFSYQFYVDGSVSADGSGYFQVLPELHIREKQLPLDAIICQTHITKLLGPLNEWMDRLQVAKESSYNMIHFTPVHLLGISNSSYSIADPLQLNPNLSEQNKKSTLEDMGKIIKSLENEWGLLSIQDVVWNHAAKNAHWLLDHPECSFNCKNSPHLRPAYVLDRLLYHFNKELAAGKWVERGVPPIIENAEHTAALRELLTWEILPRIKLEEFFQVDVEKYVNEFREIAKKGISSNILEKKLESIPFNWTRFGFIINMDEASRIFNIHRQDAYDEEDRQNKCVEFFRNHLHFLNAEGRKKTEEISAAVVNAAMGHIYYSRVDPSGPRRKDLLGSFPLLDCYFLHNLPTESWEKDEQYAYNDETAEKLMAFNGWVMNANPLENFALFPSEVYLRRELVCWGDCVKLRYGDKPEDCPFLWNIMKEYSQSCARYFHGIRIDNCHSTPIHVGEYLLKAAREIRPDLYVVAELFTGSEDLDNLFVNRLGITSLIRESQNAHDSHEQGRLVYRFGGGVVGEFIQRSVQAARPEVAHALFYDQTHDNPPALEKRSAHDLIPTAGMIAMASCANGSTRGYDELIPFKVDVVHEKRLYVKWCEIGENIGIIPVRAAINRLHMWLALNGYTQVFVDQMNMDIVAITRHNPETHDTVVFVVHTAFKKDSICHGNPPVRNVEFKGSLDEIIFEANIYCKTDQQPLYEDQHELRGITKFGVNIREHIKPNESKLVTVCGTENGYIQLNNFSSGSVIALKISPSKEANEAVRKIRLPLNDENHVLRKELRDSLQKMSLQSLNQVLFSCEPEERERNNNGTYNIPKFGSLVYAGLQGFKPVLDHISLNNDLGHPLCCNLREGLWLADYIVKRIRNNERTQEYATVIHKMMQPLNNIQFYLRPCYFEAMFSLIYRITREETMKKLHKSLLETSRFVRSLAISSISFAGHIDSAKLPPLSQSINLKDPFPSSLSAGLPHFAVGIWRNWGRDTFIGLPGCLLITGRFKDARNLILSYGGTLRHGLIPNLLGEGKCSRYNCRDAVWFWLYAIIKYMQMAPQGTNILKEKVVRIYPKDDTLHGSDQKEEELHETMYEALSRHFNGINFRERNAGRQIDEHMNDAGFNVTAHVDFETGFIYGGNQWNCGTWMDKMGSSVDSGNKGIPATPRDGAAVELQGLAFFVLNNLHKLHSEGIFPMNGVVQGNLFWSWNDWASTIKENFEKFFLVNDDDKSCHVNRRGIIKDSVGSSAVFTDFQLRPNFCITLTVAPELVSVENAWKAIRIAEEALLGPLGIKTLDPTDWNYNGYYDPSDQGTKKETAHGFNYHQGPEWIWVAAYFLRAKLTIAKRMNEKTYDEAVRSVRSRMGNYWAHLQKSPWASLTELTNKDGAFCAASSAAQAWSVGCLLETVHQLYNFN